MRRNFAAQRHIVHALVQMRQHRLLGPRGFGEFQGHRQMRVSWMRRAPQTIHYQHIDPSKQIHHFALNFAEICRITD